MLAPDVLHFYSRPTGVSMELPIGFEEIPFGAGDSAVGSAYVVLDDDDETVLASLIVQELAAAARGSEPGGDVAAANGLARAFGSGGELLEERNVEVDDRAGHEVVVRFPEGVPGAEASMLQGDSLARFTAFGLDDRVVALIGIAPWAERDSWTSTFGDIVATCRFL